MYFDASTSQGGGLLLRRRPHQPRQVRLHGRGDPGTQVDSRDFSLHGEFSVADSNGTGVGENHPPHPQGASTAGPA